MDNKPGIWIISIWYFETSKHCVRFEDHIGNKCAIVCFNVFILGKYYIYNVLPNKLTHTHPY